MVYTGRCNCGAITARIEGDPVQVRQCWCRQCQKSAAGHATTNAIFLTEDVTLAGNPATWSYTASSSNILTQSFCGQCGTPVMAQSSVRLQFRTMRVGFIEESDTLAPQIIIWTSEAPKWARLDPALPHFEGQPPAPASPAPPSSQK